MITLPDAGPVVELSAGDLPAYCPNPSMPLWEWHPRVFLDIVNENEAMCPYCGTRYRLLPNAHVDHQSGTPDLYQHHAQHAAPFVASAPAHANRPEMPNLAADALGNTTLERMTRWLRKNR